MHTSSLYYFKIGEGEVPGGANTSAWTAYRSSDVATWASFWPSPRCPERAIFMQSTEGYTRDVFCV